MNASHISYLRCPYCTESLRLNKILEGNKQVVLCGVVMCRCSSYPVFDSILILKKPVNEIVLQNMNKGRYGTARRTVLTMHKGFNAWIRHLHPESALSRLYQKMFRSTLITDLGLTRTLSPLRFFRDTRDFARYLIRLPASPESFVPEFLMEVSSQKPKIVVDIGCGITPYVTGKTFVKTKTIIGVDNNFTLLYLSRLFFPNPNQFMVCADLTHGFPICKQTADLVFSLNCFTYLHNQQTTLLAMMRALNKDGVLFLGDMISRINPERNYWYPRQPSFYTSIIPYPYISIDYNHLLTLLSHGVPIRLSDIPYHNHINRYGIIITHKFP